jgi:hypothetical protein
MFELTKAEFQNLRSQFVTSNWGGSRYVPMVFNEQGVATLSSVLNSERAILVNIEIVHAFTQLSVSLKNSIHRESLPLCVAACLLIVYRLSSGDIEL